MQQPAVAVWRTVGRSVRFLRKYAIMGEPAEMNGDTGLGPKDPQRKVLSHADIDQWMRAERAAGRRVGFTCGSFDLLHAGHAQYLAKARAVCDSLLVAVNSDASVRRYKSPLRPVNAENERMYLVAALASVDAVTILDEDRPLSLLLRWKPDF